MKVHLLPNEANSSTDVAFVRFANDFHVENALLKVIGTKIRDTYIKAFRSSGEQFQYYCRGRMNSADTITPSILLRTEPVSSTIKGKDISDLITSSFNVNRLDLALKKEENISSTANVGTIAEQYEIMARGLPWRVRRADILSFFQGINIVGGANGIDIKRIYGAMGATFAVNSNVDLCEALARNKHKIYSRTIYGTCSYQIH